MLRKKLNRMLEIKSDMTEDESVHLLTELKKPSDYPQFSQSVNLNLKYDLMIVVPVYNVEKYLRQCIESLLHQKTKYSYIIVIVDDGSTDSSNKILTQYTHCDCIKVICTMNAGVSHARNIALKNLYAKYVMFVDSDDYVQETMVEVLLDTAYKFHADIVQCGYQEFGFELTGTQWKFCDEIQQLEGNRLYGYPWGKVILSRYFENLCFPEGYQFEDTIMATLLFPFCSRIYSVPDILYYYRKNPEGITETVKGKNEAVDTFWMTKYCLEESFERGYMLKPTDYNKFLNKIRLNWMRTQKLPVTVREAIWIQTCLLYEKYYRNFKAVTCTEKILELALGNRSFKAYELLMENWWQFSNKKWL